MTQQATQTKPNGSAAEKAAEKAESIRQAAAEQVQDTVDQVRESAAVAMEQGSAELQRAVDGSSKFVRENPGLAVAGALGLGVLIGLSMRNRY
jgi:ElaB/YqjD/DUF883 family membrane-anchored ribosome-binding protein